MFPVSNKLVGEFLRAFPYVGLLFLAYWLGQREAFLVEGQLAASLPMLPYIIAAVGCVFAWNFKVSTSVLGFVVISVTFWTVTNFLPYGHSDDVFGRILFSGLSLILPLNLWWLSWAEERGVFSRAGIFRIGIILLQFMFLLVLTMIGSGGLVDLVGDLLNYQFVGKSWSNWSILPQSALLAYGLSGAFIVLRFILARSPVQIGWFGVWLATYIAFEEIGSQEYFSLYMAVAALMLAIAKIQISYRMAFVDELTGIPGRRALIADMKKLGSKYVIAMSDIDHFKKFNDTYGHDVGDQVLCMVANRLATVTGGGTAYRYGGEEFAILMPTGDVDTAMPHLERLRKIIEESSFTLRGDNRPDSKKKGTKKRGGKDVNQSVSVNISIGVASKGKEHSDPMDVMKSADMALYRAKKKGRNQVST